MDEICGKVQSVTKAMKLIDCLAKAKHALTLQELSQQAGYPKSTAHALLSTLRDCSFVEQWDDGKYRLGIRLFELGMVVSGSWDILPLARNYIQSIAAETGEPVQLTTLDKNEVLVLDTQNPNTAFRVVLSTGSRLPCHCTASGKAMLAFLPQAKTKSILRTIEIFAFTPHTMTESEQLEAELADVRRSGFAIENGEYRIGLRAVAAPIFDVTGTPKYAISVYGMYRGINGDDFLLAQRLVQSTASAISKELGYRGRNSEKAES
ncbi:MAG: IclR family transcriptional regulator [Clostridia bacterium]